MALDAVLFDLDGVLIDTRDANNHFYAEVLVSLGYVCPTTDACSAAYNLTMSAALGQLSGERKPARLRQLVSEGRRRRFPMEMTTLPVNLRLVIERLSDRFTLAIVTNGTRAAVDDFFLKSGLRQSFAATVSFDDVDRHKPDPLPIRRCLELIGVPPERAIYVGDSWSDLAAGRSAGVRVVAVAALKLPADMHADDLMGLLTLLGG